MDISLALLPWKILWGLQMRFAEKIGVCVAMSLGVLWVLLNVSSYDTNKSKGRSYSNRTSQIYRALDEARSFM
jgi:hypothetical protein